ncbi:glycosyltransferase family 2 protein [Leuconostoc kimchii]|uniref:Glycosyltransferase family 2 protein n=1 Tax=Leuconostoc kimchii TaxID=136609 RepID=A0ABX5SKH9_9LACO|nr:glycosyltransferase family 2 protein [Leuconostoc kimchii]QBR47882.1 glycosyltransferase family 2 protein [Leuconostoc kimchii]
MNMNQDIFKVSVVIAHYNASDYIKKALDSLARQTMPQSDFEVIIVDDRSTQPLDVILAYQDKLKHLKIIKESQNHGYPSIPRNHGINEARGTFVMLMDQDDNLADNTLERFVSFAGDDSDVIIGKYAQGQKFNGTQVPFEAGQNIKDASMLTDHILNTLAPHKMYRRAMLNNYDVRFYDSDDIPVEEDQVFNIKAYSVSRKISILADQDYYFWNQRDDLGNLGKSATYTYNEPWKYLNILSAVLDIIEASPVWQSHEKSVLKAMYIGRLFYSYGTLLAILKIQKNDDQREQLITGLREIIAQHLLDQDIIYVCQQSQWLVLGVKHGLNYCELQDLEKELVNTNLKEQQVNVLDGKMIRQIVIKGKSYSVPVDFTIKT